MASFNTGTTGSASNINQATAFTFTVPAGVATGDVMIVVISNFTFTSSSPGHSVPTSGGGSWTQIGTLQDTGALGGLNVYSTCWYRVATASDPSSTFSMTFSGTQGSGNQFWWSASLDSYTGFYTGDPVGAFAANTANNVGTPFTGPSATTQRASSWQVQAIAAAVSGSGSINSEPATNRELSNPGAGIDSSMSDSNGSVGGAGTSIGGGSWGFDHSSGNQIVGWTVELCTVAGPGAAARPQVPSQAASPVPWIQRDRRDANTVGTAANSLASPLDTAWQAGAAYWHLYGDSALRDRRAYFYQRPLVSDPNLLASVNADPLALSPEQSDSSELWRVAIMPAFYDRSPRPLQRAYVSDPSFYPAQNNLDPTTCWLPGAISRWQAATHADRREVPQQRAYVSDPLLLTTAQLENELLGDADSRQRRANQAATYYDRREVPQQRAYVSDPLLLTTAELENELLGGAETFKHYAAAAWYDRREVPQQRAYISDPSAYPPANPLDPTTCWLPGLLERVAAATHAPRWWMPQQPPRLLDPSFYVTPTDPLTVAWGAGGNYWHLYERAADVTDRRAYFYQRAYVSDPLLLTTALLENELLGGAGTWLRYAQAAWDADRREVPQQPPRLVLQVPLVPLDPTQSAWAALWLAYNLAATHQDRRLYPQQRLYFPVPLPPPVLQSATVAATVSEGTAMAATVSEGTAMVVTVSDQASITASLT